MSSYLSLLKIVLHGRSAGKILLATVFSFTFSIAVILCTFGLMDGFDHLLKSGLRHSSGDILITSRRGFFEFSDDLSATVDIVKPEAVAPVIQTEAFVLREGMSKGAVVRGVEGKHFTEATGLSLNVPPGEVVLGEELARQLHAQVGDEVALTFARGNESAEALPAIKVFRVGGTVQHGIYQKDLRFVYVNLGELSEVLDVGDRINMLILAVEKTNAPLKNLDGIKDAQKKLRVHLDSEYVVRPFWGEYSFLIEAVKVEKFSISLILQLIVVVAIFNIIAFVIYIMEKKSQEFFFLRAVGLSLGDLTRFWLISVLAIWAMSCLGAYLMSLLFNWCLHHLSFLQIPGEIYVLSALNVRLDVVAYSTVYAVSLLWILVAAFVGYFRLKRRPIIQGLRQEFSA